MAVKYGKKVLINMSEALYNELSSHTRNMSDYIRAAIAEKLERDSSDAALIDGSTNERPVRTSPDGITERKYGFWFNDDVALAIQTHMTRLRRLKSALSSSDVMVQALTHIIDMPDKPARRPNPVTNKLRIIDRDGKPVYVNEPNTKWFATMAHYIQTYSHLGVDAAARARAAFTDHVESGKDPI